AMCMRNGLSEADAIRCITCNHADILGIADRKGRLKEGLDADIVIWDKHPLDLQAKPETVYLRGRKVYEK
ncbi:MAG: amidohydrolase family protein, partial [Eubacteriaceae bacterium]|nr:amidohydrolase family protein [Eubacteriaceae bacterium]